MDAFAIILNVQEISFLTRLAICLLFQLWYACPMVLQRLCTQNCPWPRACMLGDYHTESDATAFLLCHNACIHGCLLQHLLEQHAICALHRTVCFMLHVYACCLMCLHVCVHSTPWDSCYCLYVQQSQTLLRTWQVPSTASRKINLRLVRLPQLWPCKA